MKARALPISIALAMCHVAAAKDVSPPKRNVCIAPYRYGGAASGWTNTNASGLFPSGTLNAIWFHIAQANVAFGAMNAVRPNEIVPPGVAVGDTFTTNIEWVWTLFPGDPSGIVQDIADPYGAGNGDLDNVDVTESNDRMMVPSKGGSTGSPDLDLILAETADSECYPVVFVNSLRSGLFGLTLGQVVNNAFFGTVSLVNSTAFPRSENAATFRREGAISTLGHELAHAVCLDRTIAGWGDAFGHPPHPQGISGNPANPPDTPEGRGFVVPAGFADTGQQLRDVITWYTSPERSGNENFTYRQAARANSCAVSLRANSALSLSVRRDNFAGLPANRILWGPAAPVPFVPPPVNLGLADGDVLDAFSYDWNKFPEGRFAFKFSVDSRSQGLPGTAVRQRLAVVTPGADEFGAPTSLAGMNNLLLLGFRQFGLMPGDDVDGLAQISPAYPDPDINGMRAVDRNMDGIEDAGARVYFSVMPNGTSGLDPGNVYVAMGNGLNKPPIAAYATRDQLGLVPGDDIDALCVQDNGNGAFDGFAVDTVLFSLTRNSPSVQRPMNPVSSSDILLGHGLGVAPVVFATAQSLGLRGGSADELDALKCYTKVVCDINRDGTVDRADIELIFAARGTRAAPGEPRDVDGDGTITTNDARICTLRCAKPLCAP